MYSCACVFIDTHEQQCCVYVCVLWVVGLLDLCMTVYVSVLLSLSPHTTFTLQCPCSVGPPLGVGQTDHSDRPWSVFLTTTMHQLSIQYFLGRLSQSVICY